MPMHATVEIYRPTPPDTYPPINAEQGRISPVATAVGGVIVGALAGGGYVASKKLASTPDAEPPSKRQRGCSHGHHTTRSTQDHARGRRRRRRSVDRDKNRIGGGPADAARRRRGLLYDATLCIGCKTCVVACQDANGLPRDTAGIDYKYDAPVALERAARRTSSSSTKARRASRS